MASDPYVREVDTITDMHGRRQRIGVDYDSVTVGDSVYAFDQAEAFARAFVSACWQAGDNARRMREEADDG